MPANGRRDLIRCVKVNFHTYGTCQRVRMRGSAIIKPLKLRGIVTQASTFLDESMTLDSAVVRSVITRPIMVILQETRMMCE